MKPSHITSGLVLSFLSMLYQSHTTAAEIFKGRDNAEYWSARSDLHVRWGKNHLIVQDVVGGDGRESKDLVGFNGSTAMLFDVRDGTPFRGYATLKVIEGQVFIECVYTEFMSRRNGLYLERGVCGLNKKLDRGYDEVINEYANLWADKIDAVDVDVLRTSAESSLLYDMVSSADIAISRKYSQADWLASELPETIISFGEMSCSLGNVRAYVISDDGDLNHPRFLDVAEPDERLPFTRYTMEDAQRLLCAGS